MAKTYRIHPAIGIARVGDSPDEFLIGPEAPGVPASLAKPGSTGGSNGKYKDKQGRVKRQAARFRIFEYTLNDAGVVTQVKEITAKDAQIEWEVHLTNRKAAAVEFPKGKRRNDGVPENRLIIDAGAQKIAGSKQGMKRLQSRFMDAVDVPLGDLLTDDAGRLIVLGGFGKSQSVPAHRPLKEFANNDGWCDDVSDGPVRAKVRLTGSSDTITADSAWIIVTPPDFAPALENVITMYDVVYAMTAKVADKSLKVTATSKVSFTKDIYPLLRRISKLHFVSPKVSEGHAPQSSGNFAERLQTLSSNKKEALNARNHVFQRLRDPKGEGGNMPKFPLPDDPDVKGRSVTDVQYKRMQRWAQGKFDADWPGPEPPSSPLDKLPEAEKPSALDRVALEACVGGPFYPGIEAGQIMLEDVTYDKKRPFRINAQLPAGALTARMAVPWQADFHECATEEDGLDWWPGQRPIQVLHGQQIEDWVPADWEKNGPRGSLVATGLCRRKENRWKNGLR